MALKPKINEKKTDQIKWKLVNLKENFLTWPLIHLIPSDDYSELVLPVLRNVIHLLKIEQPLRRIKQMENYFV